MIFCLSRQGKTLLTDIDAALPRSLRFHRPFSLLVTDFSASEDFVDLLFDSWLILKHCSGFEIKEYPVPIQ